MEPFVVQPKQSNEGWAFVAHSWATDCGKVKAGRIYFDYPVTSLAGSALERYENKDNETEEIIAQTPAGKTPLPKYSYYIVTDKAKADAINASIKASKAKFSAEKLANAGTLA